MARPIAMMAAMLEHWKNRSPSALYGGKLVT
jgi:hypothetical protein